MGSPRAWALGCALAWGAPTVAAAQDTDSGADLLDISRRAAVVDQVLAEHLDRMRLANVFRTDQRVRVAANMSYYIVSDLALTTPDEGTIPVALSRTYTGFLVDVLGPPSTDGAPGEQVFYLTGGGLAYGLNRPYELPLTGTETTSASMNDLEGTQYSDEQYAAGGRWRGFAAEASWARGQQLEATDDGRADPATLEDRLNRAQLVLDSPIGLRMSTRWAVGGPVENFAIGMRVNDAVAAASKTEPSSKVPALTLGFRKTDYAGSTDERSHPRIVGAGISEDLRWLFGEPEPGKGSVTARTRAQADLDLAQPGLQLALAEAEFGFFGRGEAAADFGASWFHDDGLAAIIGRTSTPGLQGGVHLGFSAKNRCPPPEERTPPGAVCPPNLGMRTVLSYKYRQSWAEELRYVAEYAGKPQQYVYLELMGGV
jgi:hypothetical protein